MKANEMSRHIILVISLLIAQVLLFNRFQLWHSAYCFVFISVIITTAPRNGKTANIIIAFLVGLVIDIFRDSLGVNTLCCVTLMFLRNDIYRILSSKNQEEIMKSDITISSMGLYSFSILVFICSFLYAIPFYLVNNPEWSAFGKNILTGLISSLFTALMILIVNIAFFYKRKVI